MRGLAAALVWLALAGPLAAHELSVFAKSEGGDIAVSAKFSSGKVPVNGTVRVVDETDRVVATGQLDAQGRARIPRPDTPGGLRVEIDLGNGHDGYWILTAEELAPTN